MNSTLLMAIAIIPVILILSFIQSKDKNKEPIGLLVQLFIGGVISCFMVMMVSSLLSNFLPFMNTDISSGSASFLDIFLYSFVGVALIEEFCKFIITYALSYRHKAFDEAYDIVVYAIFVALGFAGFENILYVTGSGKLATGIFRGITAVPGHACDGLFMGYYLSLAKISAIKKEKSDETVNIIKSIFVPTIMHGIYDFCCFYNVQYITIVFIIFVIFMYIVSLKKLNYAAKNNVNLFEKKQEPEKEEVLTPTVSEAEKKVDTSSTLQTLTIGQRNTNNSDYFTISPTQTIPSFNSKSDNFHFEGSGVPYIPNDFDRRDLTAPPVISEKQTAEYVPENEERIDLPIPEVPVELLNPTIDKTKCVYCGAEVNGEYCSSCGHKVK